MSASKLCFIDTETTGLNPNLHQAYEVAYAIEDGPIERLVLPHALENADPFALNVGRYFERGFTPANNSAARGGTTQHLLQYLRGVTLVGSNPGFDAAFLTKFLGVAVWNHRLINVAEGGMWVFGWDRPKGLADVATELRTRGYEIPEPDHTARGDVEATRAVYYALRAERESR